MKSLWNAGIIIILSNVLFCQGQFLQPKHYALAAGYGFQFSEYSTIRSYNLSFSLAGYLDVNISSGRGYLKNILHNREDFSVSSAMVSVHIIKAKNLEQPTAGWVLSLGFQESDYKHQEEVLYAPGAFINTERNESSRLVLAGSSAYLLTSIGKFIVIPFISAGYAFGDNEDGMLTAGVGSSIGYKLSEKFIVNLDLNGMVNINNSESVVGLSSGIIWTL